LTSITVHPDHPLYASEDGVLFNKDKTELIVYPIGRQGDYVIPDSVVKIKNASFVGAKGLTSIHIPKSVIEIGNEAFACCTGLTSIVIPNSVTEIGHLAFVGCTGLNSITIPDSITKIQSQLFRDCTALTSVTIPDTVSMIGNYAFAGCVGLTTVFIPASVSEIHKYAFSRYHAPITVHPDNPAFTTLQEEAWFFQTPLYSQIVDCNTIKLYRKRSKTGKLTLAESAKFQDGILINLIEHDLSPQNQYFKKYFEQFDYEKSDERRVYNKTGRITKVEFLQNDELISSHTFKYDRKGNKISHHFYLESWGFQCDFYSKYDKNNHIVKMDIKAINVPESTVFYEYDTVHHVSKMVSGQLKDYPECTISFVYDKDKLLEEQYFDQHGQPFLTLQYVYNSNNCLIEKTIYDKGQLFSKTVFQYDENNRRTTAQRFVDEDFLRHDRFSGIADFMM
jgi:hypothetical protein